MIVFEVYQYYKHNATVDPSRRSGGSSGYGGLTHIPSKTKKHGRLRNGYARIPRHETKLILYYIK